MNCSNYSPRIFKLKKLCLTGLLGLMSVYAAPSLATCSPLNGWTNKPGSVAFAATISVPISAAVGTVLDTKSVAVTPNGPYINCDAVTNFSGPYYGQVGGTGPIGTTNVPGVGARITFTNGGKSYVLPFQLPNTPAGTYNMTNASWKIELIKTGPITAGKMVTGAYGGYGAVGGFFATYLDITGGGQIVPATCTVSNTAVPVPMGIVNRSDFKGVGTTAGQKDFSVPLNCAAGTKIHIALAGTAHSSGAPGVLALSASSGTVAQGAGLQLLYKSAPVAFNTQIDAGTAASAGAYNIPFVARYYQTAANIVPGQANSSATFTMTYN